MTVILGVLGMKFHTVMVMDQEIMEMESITIGIGMVVILLSLVTKK